MSTNFADIPTNQIRPNPIALRGVDENDPMYLGLRDSISKTGIQSPIEVRPFKDKETGEEFYAVIDGRHRFTAGKSLGLETIPCVIVDATDDDVLIRQIMANVHRKETTPVQYAQQLKRVLVSQPFMTVDELGALVAKTGNWIRELFKLEKLVPAIQELVDKGEIKVTNAIALSRLPAEEQPNWVDRARNEAPGSFSAAAQARLKEIQKDNRAGRESNQDQFTPVQHVRRMAEIKKELESGENAERLTIQLVEDAKDKLDAARKSFNLAVSWVLQFDPESIEKQRKAHEARVADRKRKKEAAAMERNVKNSSMSNRSAYELQLFHQGLSADQVSAKMAEYDKGVKSE